MGKPGDVTRAKWPAPHPVLPAYYADPAERPGFVRDIFDRTAAHYDAINRIFSFGLGDWHRRRGLRDAGLRPGMRVLDLAVGTGAMARQALAIQGADADVVGLDASPGMLAEARRLLGIPLVLGSMECLPIGDNSVDFVSIGYALRHVAGLATLFAEVRRVLAPGGILCLLEISMPRKALHRALAAFYLGRIVPAACRFTIGSADARTLMRYHWDTIRHCVPEEAILGAMADAGLVDARCKAEFGLFRCYTGYKAQRDRPRSQTLRGEVYLSFELANTQATASPPIK